MKKIISLALCLLMLASSLVGCDAKKDPNDKGAYIQMYLTDQVYDLDPALAYNNESALRIVSLLYANLFVLNDNGKVEKSLAEKYEIDKDKNEMIIKLKTTYWTDGTAVTANDVLFAWTRLLNSENNFEAASLLYDIKNAKAAKNGDISIDDVGISALNQSEIGITFEAGVDYDAFLRNLTSYTLVPLRKDIVNKTDDWSKKPSSTCTSGPFKLREVNYQEGSEKLVLERNAYYMRNAEKDDLDEYVLPYRIIVDYTMTPEQIKEAYNKGEIFYVGDIPLSIRGDFKDVAERSDALSTHTYVLNQNAEINGTKLFANEHVRKALSMAIDREQIARDIVFAKAASALIPYGIYNSTSKKDLFREEGGNIIATTASPEAGKILTDNNINASDYTFAISVAEYDDVHMAIAEAVKNAWCALGFNVTVKPVKVIVNNDKNLSTGETSKDIKDDRFMEFYKAGNFEVAAIDYTAYSTDAFAMLAPFAKEYTGRGATFALSEDGETTFVIPTHVSGYNSDEYNSLINSAYAEKNVKKRAEILHKAEKLLMTDLPVIPIVFNVNATLTNDSLTKIEYSWYGTPIFNKAKLKDYELYVPQEQ